MYGYEEALGYCVDPDAVRDKDGIAAAVLACDLAATLKAEGAGLPDRLDALAREHGVHATAGVSVRMEPAARDAAVEELRAAPPAGWTTERPAPDVLVLRRDGERLVVRPSGTEPKLKAYLEVVEPPDDDVAAARARAAVRMAALRDEVAGCGPAPDRPPHPVARHGGAARRGRHRRARPGDHRRGGGAARRLRPGPPTCSPPTPCCSARPPTSATCRAR